MKETFKPIDCGDFGEFARKVGEFLKPESTDTWIFREHKDAEWCLETTLERACRRFGMEEGGRTSEDRTPNDA